MLFITLMTKCLIQSMRKRKTYTMTLIERGTVIAALGSGKGVPAGSPVISGAGVARSRKGRRKKGADGWDR